MQTIEVDLENRIAINTAHAEFTRETGRIEAFAEGPPIFTNGVATHLKMMISPEFEKFLFNKGFPYNKHES